MIREETSDKLLQSQVAFILENIFIDFSKCSFDSGERDSQISVSFIEKSENKYLLLSVHNKGNVFLKPDDTFALEYYTLDECYEFAKKIAWNYGYALQFGKTNIIFQHNKKNIPIVLEKNFDLFCGHEKDIIEATLISSNEIIILKDGIYYPLKDVKSIKSELSNINIDYSLLPIFLISDFFKEFNNEIDIEPEAKEFLVDYQCSSYSFINSIMNGVFNPNEFNIKDFDFSREYTIDKSFINRLFKFIDSFQECQKDMILYRGTKNELNSDSFISTSLSKDFAYSLIRDGGHKIILPKCSLFFTSLSLKKGIDQESEVILLPGNFDYIAEKDLFVYTGKSKEEVKQLLLERLETQKQQIVFANNQSEELYNEALLYGKSLINFSENKTLK